MTAYLGENIRADLAIIADGGAADAGVSLNSTLGINSKCYSLADVDRISVLCGVGPSTGVAVVSGTFTVVVGTYDAGGGSALTALTGATLSLGNTAVNSWSGGGLVEMDIACIATAAVTAGDTFSLDGTTLTAAAAGTVADKTLSTGNVAYMNDLVSALATFTTHIEVANVVTASTLTRCSIRPRDYGFAGSQTSGMGVTATTNATTGEVELIPKKYEGLIEFTANDVLATNSSFTHFAIRLNTTVTTTPMAAMVIRTGGINSTNTKRVQL